MKLEDLVIGDRVSLDPKTLKVETWEETEARLRKAENNGVYVVTQTKPMGK